MKRIKEIRIPKYKKCIGCIASSCYDNWCNLFGNRIDKTYSQREGYEFYKCNDCLKMFPNGAVFELKEGK